MNLYQVDLQIEYIISRSEETGGEITDEQSAELDKLYAVREELLVELVKARQNYLTQAEATNIEIERLKAVRAKLQDRAESCERAVLKVGGKELKLSTPLGTVRFQPSVKMEVLDKELIPKEFQRANTGWEPDKAKARALVMAGEPCPAGFTVLRDSNFILK
jgi:viroplasmin and RNaseH domain-containing protein